MRWPIGWYKRHKDYNRTCCYYCGVTEQEKELHDDHYPPRSRKYEFPDYAHLTIRACYTCNYRLGNSMQATLEERTLVAKGLVNPLDSDIQGTEPREAHL